MSIPEIEPVKNHYGNNSATSFDFDFYIEKSSQLKVQHTDLNGILTTLKENVDYSIHEIGNENGSYITFPIQGSTYSALAWDTSTDKKELLTISLNLPLKQEFEFNISGDLDKHQLEKALDYQMRVDQILNRKINRAVLVPEGSELTPSEMIETIHNSRITAVQAANDAAMSATNAQNSLNTINQKMEEFSDNYNSATNDIQKKHSDAIIDIENNLQTAEDTIIADRTEAIQAITKNKNNAISDITTTGAGQVAKIKQTGFYMQDDKLYYIDSNGETKEFKSGGGLEVCDIGMSLFVDETKGLRRRLNGQIVDINTNTQWFLTRLKQITTLYPSLLCTEEEWQTTKTLSVYGQVGRFVFNYSNDGTTVESVRLPAVVNVQGLMDLANTGFTVPAGLPTHTHTRGNMNITGAIYNSHYGNNNGSNTADSTGAFSRSNLRASMMVTGNVASIYGTDYYFNAANSWTGTTSAPDNSIYGNSSTVQPEAIQYPYFIQIATGQETEVNIKDTLELNNPFTFGMNMYFKGEMENISWLKSVGQQNAKALYPDFYNWVLTNANAGKAGFKLSTASDITDYDFEVNTTDETFRLPLKNGMEGALIKQAPVVGNGMTVGLTDGSRFGGLYGETSPAAQGNLSSVMEIYGTNVNTSSSSANTLINSLGITTDPSKSGLVADLSNVTVPTGYNLYYYVGVGVKNPNLIDAGRIAENMPNMANRNLSNLSDFGKIMCAKNAFAQIHYDPNDFSKIGAYWSAQNLTSGSVNFPDGGLWLTFVYKYNAATEAGLINSVFELGIVPGGKKFTVEGNYPHYYFYGIRIQEA